MLKEFVNRWIARTQPTRTKKLRRSTTTRRVLESLEPRLALSVSVAPTVTSSSVSAADDPAIWIHPTDTSLSTVIGTDKSSSHGLRVFNLSGTQIQSVNSGKINNVDVRYNFTLGSSQVSIVAGSNESQDSISIYRVDPATGLLENAAARIIKTGIDVYGFSLYNSKETGKFYAFVNAKNGVVEQWELFDNGAGKIDGQRVRSFDVGKQVEGMVADDEHGYLYVGEEDVAIWRYDAEPNAGTSRTVVDTVGAGRLKADVEGLAIYYGPNGTGHLIASSQGNDEFVVYERTGTNAHMGTFELAGVKNTDGIEVTNVGLGSQFAQGMFVAQNNDKNFKFVPWQSIATSISPALIIDVNAWDPRGPYVPPEPPGNQAPQVNAGNDLATTVGFAVQLDATVSDDGLPAGPVTTTWTLDSGPAAVSFANAQSVATTAMFSTPGIYNLRLTVGDGELTHSDLVQVTVTEAPTNYTASFQDGVTTNGQYRGTRDTMLEGKKPNATNGADKKLSVDGSPDQAILLRWDVSSLSAGSPVQSAQLVLQVSDKSDESYPLFAVLRDWDETTATWNQAASGTNWATIGAQGTSDRGTTQIGTLRATSKGTATVELSAAGIALVQSWIDNPSTNFGIVIQNYNNSNALKIASREATSGRPRLNINIGAASSPQPTTALAIATALESDATIRKLKSNTRF